MPNEVPASTAYPEAAIRLTAYRDEIRAVRERMRQLQSATVPEAIDDYVFVTTEGPVRLSELFGRKNDLIMIHNMGTSCPNCTMWADGFNGVLQHLTDRAAFVVSSPDPPDRQKQFAAARGWRFRMVSHAGTAFAEDMGYRTEDGRVLPGLSVFRREGTGIVRVSDAPFSPGDDFCAVWHIFDLLPDAATGWRPRFDYL